MASKKIKLDGKANILIIIAVIAVAAIALLDILSMNSGVFGTVEEYTLGNYTPGWWGLFYNIVLLIMFGFSTVYFILYKDIVGSGLLIASMYTIWMTGFADILYFLFQLKTIPETLPWLNKNPLIFGISSNLGFVDVTPVGLIISAAVGVVASYLIIKLVVKK